MSELKELTICGKTLKLGDFVRVEYTKGRNFKGAQIWGTVTKLWPAPGPQVQVNNGWCFHEGDLIVEHKKGEGA